jgi:DNA mismatch endonuclease (patch repair protein)
VKRVLTRSEMMSRIRSRDTGPELRTRSHVHRMGHRFRAHVASLPGKPDLANRTKRWVIFVHGCFWHSHENCHLASKPKSNTDYWRPKLLGNQKRDKARQMELTTQGFRVLVVWECETRDPDRLDITLRRFFRTSSR